VWRPDHLEELDALRRSFSEAALIGCKFERFSGSPNLATRARPGERRLVRYFGECARGRELFVTSSAAVTREALKQVGDFKPLPGNEDVELWARLALHAPVAFSSKPTVLYRVDSGGITNVGIGQQQAGTGPTAREELSSTIPLLDERLPGIRDPRLRREIIAYMDSRIGLSLVAAVRWGHLDRARHLRSLYTGRPAGQARIASILMRLPPAASRLLFSGLRRLRQIGTRR
jgi:hypothetical protein